MRDESPQPSQLIFPVQLQPAESDEEPQIPQGHEWGWLEAFVLIQVMWGLLLFLPGSQAYRTYIRAFPYVSSLLALVICVRSIGADSAGPGARWVLSSLLLMVFMLMHPGTWLMSGVAQIVFQLALAAPIFWSVRVWLTAERLERLIFLVFAAHFFSAGLGLLQVYYPDTFLPPEFSSLGMKLNPEFVHELSYLGTDDRLIIRPPGLSDMPGGAAISGVIAALLAFGFATRSNISFVNRAYYLGAVARLRPDVTLEVANQELAAIMARAAIEFPQTNKQFSGARAEPFRALTTESSRSSLELLLISAGLVLLVSVINLTGLQLSRYLDRERERAVRRALGATRWQLARQVLVEKIIRKRISRIEVGAYFSQCFYSGFRLLRPGPYHHNTTPSIQA